MVNLVTGQERALSFSPDNPFEYGLLSPETSWVEIPDVSGAPGAFDPGKDPYAKYTLSLTNLYDKRARAIA